MKRIHDWLTVQISVGRWFLILALAVFTESFIYEHGLVMGLAMSAACILIGVCYGFIQDHRHGKHGPTT